jgi:stage V sporulation protein B
LIKGCFSAFFILFAFSIVRPVMPYLLKETLFKGWFMKRSAFFEKTIILTVSNILTGTLSFIFSILLSREIGPKGMGLYQLVMPLYTMFLFVTGGGITVTLSKIAAEKKATGNLRELYKTVKVICLFEVVWSAFITSIVFLLSRFLSINVLSDGRTLYAILAFCPALVIISLSSIFKGTYYGLQKVVEPALIDVVEKIFRIAIMYPLVMLTKNMGIEFTAASAVFALSSAELISLILFYICYKNYVRKNPCFGKCDNSFQLIFNVLKLAIPLAINGILSTVFSTITAVMIPKRLQVAGIPYEEALSMFGKLQGMALTIAFYPSIILSALSVILIPSISEAVTFKKSYIVNHRMNLAIRIASVTAFSSTAILLSIPHMIGKFLFKDPAVGDLLQILAPALPLIYIEITTFAILNGLGKQTSILINSTIISISDLILLYIFLAIPSINIKGYGINFIFSAILGLVFNFAVIRRTFSFSFNVFSSILLPFMCSVFLYIVINNFLVKLNSAPVIILFSYVLFLAIYIPLHNISKTGTKRFKAWS